MASRYEQWRRAPLQQIPGHLTPDVVQRLVNPENAHVMTVGGRRMGTLKELS